eukprot:3074918-Rhodomonas_salina.3
MTNGELEKAVLVLYTRNLLEPVLKLGDQVWLTDLFSHWHRDLRSAHVITEHTPDPTQVSPDPTQTRTRSQRNRGLTSMQPGDPGPSPGTVPSLCCSVCQ